MRWKYVIPTVVILAAIIVFNIFFFDALLKAGLIKAGEIAFGARVEITSLKTSFTRLSIAIGGVQAADRQKPMLNLVELGSVRFSVQPVPLLSKKVVINEMTVAGVQWGTARKTSGALPPAKLKKIDQKQSAANKNNLTAKLMAKLEARGQAEMAGLPGLETIQKTRSQFQNISVDSMVKVSDLQSIKQLDAMKTEYQQKAASYDTQIKSLNVSAKVQSAQPVFNELSSLKISTPQDAAAAKEKIEASRNKVQELQTTYGQVQKLKKDAEQDFGQSQQLINRINELKEKDLKALANTLQLPSFSYENLARALVGPPWLSRINQVIGYMNLARNYMPPRKKAEKKTARQRAKGMDIIFPVSYMPPDFWIKKIIVSGTTGGPGKKNRPLDFKGEILNVTTDPVMLGQPTQARFQAAQGRQTWLLLAVLDHTQEVAKDSLEILMKGFPASELKLPESEYLPSFGQGSMTLHSLIKLQGENLAAQLQVVLSDLGAPEPSSASQAEVQNLVRELWKNIPAVSVNANMSGTAEDLRFAVSSNLDSILSQRLKAMLGSKLTELQQKLRAGVDKQLAAKQKEVMNQFNQSKQQVLSKIGVDEKQVQEKINSGQSIIKQKEEAGRQAVEQQKKQAEKQMKDNAQDKIKGLFGK